MSSIAHREDVYFVIAATKLLLLCSTASSKSPLTLIGPLNEGMP
jgi:hypothetical protein